MKKLLPLFVLFTINVINAQLVHPGISHKMSDLERMKSMVEAGEEPWFSSYKAIESSGYALSYGIRGNASVTTITTHGPFMSDSYAAYANALLWYITGNEAHAQKCVDIFNSWVNITRIEDQFALNNGRGPWKMCEAAEIIKHTYTGWDTADQQKFADMLVYPGYSTTTEPTAAKASKDVSFYWNIYQGDRARHGNQGLFAYRSMMAMAIFLDNEIMYDRALRYLQGLPHRSDDLAYPSGPPITTDRADECVQYFDEHNNRGFEATIEDYGYNEVMSNYIYENGQCQESARDQVHTLVGISIIACIAEMAWNQGDDLYGHLDNRLLLGYEYTLRYGLSSLLSFPDQPSPWEPTVESGEFIERTDRSGRWTSKAINPWVACNLARNSRGEQITSGFYSMNLAHYRDRMGLPTEDYKWLQRGYDYLQSVKGIEDGIYQVDYPTWGEIKFQRVSPGDPISGFDSEDLPIFSMPTIPATIEAEHYDYFSINGNERTYYDTEAGNRRSYYRTDEDVDLIYANGSNSSSGYAVGYIADGEWLTYTVNVATDGYYKFNVESATLNSNNNVKFYVDDVAITSDVNLPTQSSLFDFESFEVVDGVYLDQGVHSIKVEFSVVTNSINFNSFSIENGSCYSDDLDAFSTIEAENYCLAEGIDEYTNEDVVFIGNIQSGDYSEYGIIDFGSTSPNYIELVTASQTTGNEIEVYIDDTSPSNLIATVPVTNTTSWYKFSTEYVNLSDTITGTHKVILVYTTGGVNVDSFVFSDGSCFTDTVDAFSTIEAEDYCYAYGIQELVEDDVTYLGYIHPDDYTEYSLVDFGSTSPTYLELVTSSRTDANEVEVYLDNITTNNLIATVPITNTGSWYEFSTNYVALSESITGTHKVILVYSTGGVNVDSFKFSDGACITQSFVVTNSIQAEDYCEGQGVNIYGGGTRIGSINDGDWVKYGNINFGTTGIHAIEIAAGRNHDTNTYVDVYLDSMTSSSISTVAFTNTGAYSSFDSHYAELSSVVTDVHDVYLVFRSDDVSVAVADLDSFIFLDNTCAFSSYDITSTVEAENYCDMSGVEGVSAVTHVHNGDWLRFSGFDFGTEGANVFSFNASSTTSGGTIELRSGSYTGTLLASVAITNTGAWSTYEDFEGNITTPITGVHDLYLVFKNGSGYLFNIDNFTFSYDACHLQNFVATDTIEGEDYCDSFGVRTSAIAVNYVHSGDWVKYANVDFGSTGVDGIEIEIGKNHDTATYVDIHLDSMTSASIATIELTNTGNWNTFTTHYAELSSSITDVHDVYLMFSSSDTSIGIANIDSFTFGNYNTLSVVNYDDSDYLGIHIYPNPVRDYLQIYGVENVLELSIYDLSGQLIITASDSNVLDVSSIASGMYFVQIQTSQQTFVKKIIKE